MIGQEVENFILNDEKGNTFNLYDNLDKKVLLVFYPKDNSPVCSRQLGDYQKNKEKFSNEDIKIIGINPESAEKHKSFCNSIGVDFPLLVDEKNAVSKKLDATNFFGGTRRKLVLIGKDKKVIFENNIFPLFYLNSTQIINLLKDNHII